MSVLLIAILSGVGFIIAYHTYGKWLGSKIFNLSADYVCPSRRLEDGADYVPTNKSIVFGHHFTSIAGTGPIVGPAIAVMWGWLPALLWVVFGSILIGAVHDFGSLVVSLRNNGQTVGDIAGRVLNRRVRLLFLFVLFMALTIVLAIFGLVIAAVFRQFPAAIFPCVVQIPIAVGIGLWLHRKGINLLFPSLLALGVMYLTVYFGNDGFLGAFNSYLSGWPMIAWVIVLLGYSYVASVLPVWILLQPRDYINSLQLLTALALVLVGLGVAAFAGGAPPTEGAARPALEIAAPMVRWSPEAAPMIFPFLFITIACGAISGFHCLVSSGTSSKQIENEPDARFIGYGSMLTEGFLATLVILACVAGLGLGVAGKDGGMLTGVDAYEARYASWTAANGLPAKVGAFVDGSANFLKSFGMPSGFAIALMGVLVASFAGTTLDTACRLQRYVVQELAATFAPRVSKSAAAAEGYDDEFNEPGVKAGMPAPDRKSHLFNPLYWLTNKHGATIFAITIATVMAALPPGATPIGFVETLTGNVPVAEAEAALAANVNPDAVASMQAGGIGGAWTWLSVYGGKGGLILWPMFGATNQLLGGLAFLVITFYLWRRGKPIWFVVLPLIFMLIMPAAAMLILLPEWLEAEHRNWWLIGVAIATLVLELWMIIEALLLMPRIKGVLEEALPGAAPDPAAPAPAASGG